MPKKKKVAKEEVTVTQEQNEFSKIVARFANEEPWFIADRPDTPKKKLIELAKDERPLVRMGVAKNVNTPLPVVKKLVKDRDNDVGMAAVDNLLTRRRDGYELTEQELFECAHVLSHGNNLLTLEILGKLKERTFKKDSANE